MDIDRLTIEVLTKALDKLVSECLDKDGKPKAPSQKAIMQARGYLPAGCEMAFQKKDRRHDHA